MKEATRSPVIRAVGPRLSKRSARPKRFRALLLLAVVGTVPAISAFRVNAPFAVRITAYVNEKAKGVNPDFHWIVAEGKTEYSLYIVNVLVMNGEVLPGDINQAVESYHVSFQLDGDKGALRNLKEAPPRKPIVINAYLSFGEGGRFMMLNTVAAAAEPTVEAPASRMK